MFRPSIRKSLNHAVPKWKRQHRELPLETDTKLPNIWVHTQEKDHEQGRKHAGSHRGLSAILDESSSRESFGFTIGTLIVQLGDVNANPWLDTPILWTEFDKFYCLPRLVASWPSCSGVKQPSDFWSNLERPKKIL